MSSNSLSEHGFTLVELMIVMAVIAILATMGLFGYKDLSAKSKADRDIEQIFKLIRMNRVQYDKTLGQITGNWCSECSCRAPCDYTCDTCKNVMDATMRSLGLTGALNDPWGYYYAIDENELEFSSSDCRTEGIYSRGYSKWKQVPVYSSNCNGNP